MRMSSSSLVLSRHPPEMVKCDWPSAMASDFSGHLSSWILRSRIMARSCFVKKNVDNGLIAEQTRYKYNYDERVWEALIVKPNKLVFFDRSHFAAKTNILNDTAKPSHIALVPRADGPLGIISVQHHKLTINESACEKWYSSTRKRTHQATIGTPMYTKNETTTKSKEQLSKSNTKRRKPKVAKTERCNTNIKYVTGNRYSHLKPNLIKNGELQTHQSDVLKDDGSNTSNEGNINTHRRRNYEGPEFNEIKDERPAPKQLSAHRRHSD